MTTRVLGRLLVVLVAAFLGLLVAAPGAAAHPLGNFTVNSYSSVVVQPDSVVVQLVVDSAEIPTVQEFPDVDREGVSDAAAAAYATEDCERAAPGLSLTLDGTRQPLAVTAADLTFVPGQAGLATMRLSSAGWRPLRPSSPPGRRSSTSTATASTGPAGGRSRWPGTASPSPAARPPATASPEP